MTHCDAIVLKEKTVNVIKFPTRRPHSYYEERINKLLNLPKEESLEAILNICDEFRDLVFDAITKSKSLPPDDPQQQEIKHLQEVLIDLEDAISAYFPNLQKQIEEVL